MSDEKKPDDSEPTPERQADLRKAYIANVTAGKTPYAGVVIRTLSELTWVMRERDWSGDLDAEGKARADLRGADLFQAAPSDAADLFQAAPNDAAGLFQAALSDADYFHTLLAGMSLADLLQEAMTTHPDLFQAAPSDAELVQEAMTHPDMVKAALAALSDTDFLGLILSSARLNGVNLSGADLYGANLSGANLYGANLSDATLYGADLSSANLFGADLSDANLSGVNLSGANLFGADLSDATLSRATLSSATLSRTDLSGADLRATHMNADTTLTGARLDVRTRLADIVWNGVPVTRLTWDKVDTLGDEWVARQAKNKQDKPKDKATRLEEFQDAVLANRQVATLLRSQGLNEPADRFALRAQVIQRGVQRRRHQYLRYMGSLLLDLLAGYGFRPGRAILLYLAVIIWFANFYVWASHGLITFGLPPSAVEPLAWYEALILSVSSFHGRGFQPFQHLNDPIAALAGIQAVLGLVIEVSFIATFTNRFFAR